MYNEFIQLVGPIIHLEICTKWIFWDFFQTLH